MSFAEEYRTVLQRIQADNLGVRSLPYFIDVADRWHGRFVDEPDQTDGWRRSRSANEPGGTADRCGKHYADEQSLTDGRRADGPGGKEGRRSGRRADEPSEAAGTRAEPRVVVLGHGIPEELIHACGTTPYFVLGGSHASCDWSDDLVPRDSDPISRSILGYVTRIVGWDDIDPLFIVPMANDNLRKIAYLLKREGHAVVAVDIPPEGAGISSQRAWVRSVSDMVEAVERHVGGRASAQSIRHADRLVAEARMSMLDLKQAIKERAGVLSNEAALFVLGTYYQTDDLARWSAMVRRLADEIRTSHHTIEQLTDRRPRVLVIGSSILFPQYKVPTLIREAGLALVEAADASSTARYASLTPRERKVGPGHLARATAGPGRVARAIAGPGRIAQAIAGPGRIAQAIAGPGRLVRAIARKHYALDASGARATNEPMEQYVSHLLSTTNVDGIVCHVLKGHIEYDFELARLERLFDQRGIPVFRLETDYQYQDVEQLRIRLEAFAEMLEQRALVASRATRLRYA